jgi:hypothetical protein
VLRGRSLILVDTSGSMTAGRSAMSPVKAAAVFGTALAARGEQAGLHGFADGVFRHDVRRGASVIREVDRFVRRAGRLGRSDDPRGLRGSSAHLVVRQHCFQWNWTRV